MHTLLQNAVRAKCSQQSAHQCSAHEASLTILARGWKQDTLEVFWWDWPTYLTVQAYSYSKIGCDQAIRALPLKCPYVYESVTTNLRCSWLRLRVYSLYTSRVYIKWITIGVAFS